MDQANGRGETARHRTRHVCADAAFAPLTSAVQVIRAPTGL